MRKNFGVKTYLFPQPVMIIASYDENGNPDAMNAAWGGICGHNRIMFDLGSHQTTDNILKTGAFTVACGDSEHVTECDYVGIVSARDVPDKLKTAGFETIKSDYVNAPVITNLPVTLECKLDKVIDGSIFIGEIINVSADEKYLGEDGLPNLSKFTPISFEPVHHKYNVTGETLGNAFSDGNRLKK